MPRLQESPKFASPLPTLLWVPTLLLFVCHFWFCGHTSAQQETDKAAARSASPNIVLVMTDDQGYGDLGCHGHPFLKTPNLDMLHKQSTRFVDFHVSPTCAPTRSALMSGTYPFKCGVTHTILERDRMALSRTTIAQILKSAGYTTGIFGKWHLGDDDPYQPSRRGFDETFIHGAGGIGQNYQGSQGDSPGTSYFNPIIKHNGKLVTTEGYCTDVFFHQALGWMNQQRQQNQPFFAYIATNAPHAPYNVDEKYSLPFQDKCKSPSDRFLGMIVNIDENIGLLMEKLDEWEIADNTLLIFMTDNGSASGSQIFNAGMRGGKGTVHEGGARVPLFMRLPGVTKPGLDIETMSRHVDLLPTLAAFANAKLPEGLEVDGRNLLPLIHDPDMEWPARYTFFHQGRWAKKGANGNFGKGDPDPDAHKYENYAVRNEQWRLVSGKLYNLQNDPGESKDVAADHPQVVAEMMAAYDKWWDEVRPLMVNEDAPLDVPKPFVELYQKQMDSPEGIPAWTKPVF